MANLAERPDLAPVRDELARRMEEWMRETDDPLLHGDVPAPPGAKVDQPYVPEPSDPEGFRLWEPPDA